MKLDADNSDRFIASDEEEDALVEQLLTGRQAKDFEPDLDIADSFTHIAAGIMYLDQTGKALFVRRSSKGDHAGEWCFPGGAVEPGETVQGAAARESSEEIGHIPGDLEQVDRRDVNGVDFTTFVSHVPAPFLPVLNGEHTTYAWNRLDDAPEPLHPGVRATIDTAVLGDAGGDFDEDKHPRDKDGKFANSGHAAKKGEHSPINGYFYKGGQFLPTTTAPPGTWRIKSKGKATNLANGAELIEPGKFAQRPTPFSRSVHQVMGGGTLVNINNGVASLNPRVNWDYVGSPDEKQTVRFKQLASSKEKFSTNDLIGLYNKGVRWIDLDPNPGVEIIAKGDKNKVKDDATWKEELHPRDKDGKFAEAGALPKQLDVSTLTKIGDKKGSNDGGTYQSPSGDQYYIKQPASKDHVQNELLAAKLYKLAGANTLEYVPVSGDEHVATKLEALDKNNVSQLTPNERMIAQQDLAVHAWLANWDAVGTGGDNIGVRTNADGSKSIVTLDTGGSLKYRAKGGEKGAAFGGVVNEINTLRDPSKNPDAAKLYGDMTNDQIKSSIKRVTDVPDHVIMNVVEQNMSLSPMSDRTAMANKLIARKNDLAAQAALMTLGSPTVQPTPAAASTKPSPVLSSSHAHLVKGNFGERVDLKKQLKDATNSVDKKELQNKILASYVKQHNKVLAKGDPNGKLPWFKSEIDKHSKKYGLSNPLTATVAPAPAHSINTATAPTSEYKPTFGKKTSTPQPTGLTLPKDYDKFTQSEKEDFDDIVKLVATNKGKDIAQAHDLASTYVNSAASRLKNVEHDDTLNAIGAAHIVAYSGSQYRETNSALRAGKMTEAVYKHTEALDSALSKLPAYTGTLYRKADLSPSVAMKYEPGHVVVEHAFTSTSKKPSVWSGDYKYTIEARGKRAHDIMKLSSHGDTEAEVLYRSGSKFLVTKREGYNIWMREL